MNIIGLTRVRNEEAIINDTLDHLSQFCSGIWVFDDASTDATPDICARHPAVVRVIRNQEWDPFRERAEYQNRARLLTDAQLSAKPEDWFVYVDADERMEFSWDRLQQAAPDVLAIRMRLFDFYITPGDVNLPYFRRKWLGPEYRSIIFAFRNLPTLAYRHLDQREVELGQLGTIWEEGFVRHYGKALSITHWEAKCDFYVNHFPGYAHKWRARRGKAIHTKSDFGFELIKWHERETKGILLTEEIMAKGIQEQSSLNSNLKTEQTISTVSLENSLPNQREPLNTEWYVNAPVPKNNDFVISVPRAKEKQADNDPNQPMRILLGTHHLLDFTGSEIYTATLAQVLKEHGHEVVVYSKFVDQLNPFFQTLRIPVVEKLEDIQCRQFDVSHVHHNTTAIEVRSFFPRLPMVFLAHGVLPFLEQPPAIPLNISCFLAVSEEVQAHLQAKGIPAHQCMVVQNLVDSRRFFPIRPISSRPRKAIIISNRIDAEIASIIRKSCNRNGIDCRCIGLNFREIPQSVMPFFVNDADIVFSLGRGAIEAMLCGRIPIIFDYQGSDGMVTPGNLHEIMKCNFSGRRYHRELSEDELSKEINKYDSRWGNELREQALHLFDTKVILKSLLAIYKEAQNQPVPELPNEITNLLSAYAQSQREAVSYSFSRTIRPNVPGRNMVRDTDYSVRLYETPNDSKTLRQVADLMTTSGESSVSSLIIDSMRGIENKIGMDADRAGTGRKVLEGQAVRREFVPLMIKAHQLLEAKDFPAALEQLELVLKRREDYQGLHLLRAHAFIGLDRWTQALVALNKELAAHPDHPDALELKKSVTKRLTSHEETDESKRHAAALKLCEEGGVLVTGQKYGEALLQFDSAISLERRINGCQYARALCLRELGRLDDAEKAVRTELELQPNNKDARVLFHELRKFVKKNASGEREISEPTYSTLMPYLGT